MVEFLERSESSKVWEHSVASCKGTRDNFARGIRILCFVIRITAQGIWNPTNDWNSESKVHLPRIRNTRCGIQNSRLSWIPLRGVNVGKLGIMKM